MTYFVCHLLHIQRESITNLMPLEKCEGKVEIGIQWWYKPLLKIIKHHWMGTPYLILWSIFILIYPLPLSISQYHTFQLLLIESLYLITNQTPFPWIPIPSNTHTTILVNSLLQCSSTLLVIKILKKKKKKNKTKLQLIMIIKIWNQEQVIRPLIIIIINMVMTTWEIGWA